MALVNCKECGFKISDKAPACVHCGAPVPPPSAPAGAPPKKKNSKALWLLLLIASAALIFGWNNGLDKEFQNISAVFSPPKSQAIAPVSSVILVSAIQLFKDYKANKVSADLTYRGKSLLVNGVIDSIHKNITNAPYLAISGGGPSKMVRAHFLKSELPRLSGLKRGQKITVACTGDSMLTGSPVLKGCAISEPEISALPNR